MKTIEVEDLKLAWKRDPCWDLETTEGFECHRQELSDYASAQELIWENEHKVKLQEKATKLGIPDRLDLVGYLNGLEHQINKLEEKIHQLENRD